MVITVIVFQNCSVHLRSCWEPVILGGVSNNGVVQHKPQQLDTEETIQQLNAAETKWILNLQTLRLNSLNSILVDPHYRNRWTSNSTTVFILQSTNIDATTGKSYSNVTMELHTNRRWSRCVRPWPAPDFTITMCEHRQNGISVLNTSWLLFPWSIMAGSHYCYAGQSIEWLL